MPRSPRLEPPSKEAMRTDTTAHNQTRIPPAAPIPSAGPTALAIVPLSALPKGAGGVVSSLTLGDGPAGAGHDPLWRRLHDLGFVPGQRVRVVSAGALGGPLAVRVGELKVALRREEAGRVLVSRSAERC